MSETDRLGALAAYEVLDTAPEPGFDDIAALAAELCDAPTALVTFVDGERQFFKASVGFSGSSSAPLDTGFCPLVVETGRPLVIPDACADPAHADNPAVRAGGVRFYAGVPLVTREGQVIGTLCVLSPEPRPEGLAPGRMRALQALAGQVMTQLAYRRSVRARDAALAGQRDTIRMQDALVAAQAGVAAAVDLEAVLDTVIGAAMGAVPQAEGGVIELGGGDGLEYVAVRGNLVEHRGLTVPLHGSAAGHCWRTRRALRVPDVLADPHVQQDLAERLALRSCVLAPIERGGRVVAVLKLQSSRVDAFADRDLQAARIFAGVATAGLTALGEVRARRGEASSAARTRAILDSTVGVAIIATDRDGLVTDWNAGAERILGWAAGEMEHETVERIFTPEDRAGNRVAMEMRDSLREGRAAGERWHLRKDGTRFFASGEMMPLRDAGLHVGFVKVLRDRTAEHLAGVALETAEARLHRAQEAGGIGLFSVDIPDGSLQPTPEFCRLYGLPVRDAYPCTAFESLVVPEDAHLVSSAASRAGGAAPPDVEYRIRRADTGALRWIARRGEIERDAAGRPVRFSGVSRDVTEQRQAHEALLATEERYRLATRATNDAIWDWDLATDHVLWNEALTTAYGHAPETVEPTGGWWLAHVHPEDRARIEGSIHAVIDRAGATWAEEYRFLRADGSCAEVFDRAHVIRDAAGRAVRMIGAMLDLTRMRRAETALRENQERFRTTLDVIDVAFAVVRVKFDADDRPVDYFFVEANPAFERQVGVNLRGKWVTEFAPDLERFWFETYGRVAWTGEPANFESYAEAFGRWFDVRAVRIGDPAERQIAIFFSDVTERRIAQERLRASETLARQNVQRVQLALAAGAIIGTWHWDLPSDRFIVDEAFALAFGLDPALGREGIPLARIVDTVHPDDQAGLAAAIAEAIGRGGAYAHQYRTRRADGRYYWLEANGRVEHGPDGTPLSFPGVLIDVEERRSVEAERERVTAMLRDLNETLEQRVAKRTAELMQAEDALRQSQKMEAVGQLTGGLAHDFNNLLAGISGSLEMMSTRIDQGRLKDVEKYMVAAQGASKRAAALTHRLLAFSRRQTLDPKPTDVNALVGGMMDLVRRTVGPGIDVETVGAGGLWPALVDPSQLENALLNLCINARDAMPEGGRITVGTANRCVDGHGARQHDLPEGQYLSLCVTDTGTGMPPEVIAKAFDPFFTTKPLGQGTGLGLSMIYGFAKQSGGQVRIYSELGRGTTVCIYLPRHRGEAAVDEAGPERTAPPLAEAGETVLIVDDEPTVRMLVTDVLGDLGYTAIEAADGAGGLRVLLSDARIDLLVTDVGLPGGMNGRQVADAARAHRPDLKVLFITGFAENALLNDGQLEPGMSVLTKPFAVDTLAARIRELIAS